MPVRLARPGAEHLAEYADALRRGFEPSTYDGPGIARAHLEATAQDPGALLARMDDPECKRPPIVLKDGSEVARIPGFTRFILDAGFCGVIHFRWQPGTSALPPHVQGHIGDMIVPWRRREGLATRTLGLLLKEIAPFGLPWVELTSDPGNAASIRVIEANGGVLVERFRSVPMHGGKEAMRFRIALPRP